MIHAVQFRACLDGQGIRAFRRRPSGAVPHTFMAIWRHVLVKQRFSSPQKCIFAKLVTKVAKRKS
ncbi:hypothetical protein X976_5806 [Burkholderia pseudomallei MSHR7500]|nr:hypothetical protein X976_5806 [Burkholderia pseudomallei MSHR7500]